MAVYGNHTLTSNSIGENEGGIFGLMTFAARLVVALATLGFGVAQQTLPTVDLNYTLQQATQYYSQYDAYAFLDVRYAAPPTGSNRFRAPLPPAVNRTVQTGGQRINCTQSNSYLGQEDCLFLDVWTPRLGYNNASNPSFAGLPVLVWIYGGGYNVGSKADDEPWGFFAQQLAAGSPGFVWVALNYRLGAFGWLSGPTFTQNGDANAGLLDQRFALEWVQTNIRKFGGDPARVTVMGESAGGGSVMHQITAYGGTKGNVPFIRAIPQSPGYRPNDDPGRMNKTFNDFLSLLKVTTIDQARALPFEQLRDANGYQIGSAYIANNPYGPVVDGKFVPDLPGKLFYAGKYDKRVNIMPGHNVDEGYAFTDQNIQTNDHFRQWVILNLPAQVGNISSNVDYVVNNMYPPIFDGSQAQNYTNNFERADAFTSELKFTCNNYFMNKANPASYGYYFSVPISRHGTDLQYTFYPGGASSDPRVPVALQMQASIMNFVANGNPNGPGLPAFPVYAGNNATLRNFNISGASLTVRDPASNTRCDIFQTAL